MHDDAHWTGLRNNMFAAHVFRVTLIVTQKSRNAAATAMSLLCEVRLDICGTAACFVVLLRLEKEAVRSGVGLCNGWATAHK